LTEEKVRTRTSAYPLIAGLIVFFLITRFIGHIDHIKILAEVWRYVISGGAELITWPTDVVGQIMLALGYAVIGIPVAVLANIVATILIGKRRDEYSVFGFFPQGRTVNSIFMIILLEELFARQLFQGMLGNWLHTPFITGLVGNASWASIHVFNWSKEDRQIGRALPQFVAGLVFMAVYAVGGLWWAVLAHFTYDALLFGMEKREGGWGEEVAWGIYHALLALGTGLVIWGKGIDLSALMPWLQATETLPQLALTAFQTWLVVTFIDAVAEMVLATIGYDINAAVEGGFGFGIGEIIAVAIAYLNIWIFTTVGRWLGWTPFEVAVAITITGVLATKVDTPSSIARAWFRLPVRYLLVAIFMTHGFWTVVLMLVGWGLLNIIPTAIRRVTKNRESGSYS